MNKGLEFTYSLWININSLEYNKDKKIKPIFYKSKKETVVEVSESDYAPGVFLLDNTNTLRIAMQTGLEEAQKMEYIDVTNISSVPVSVGSGGNATHYYGNSSDGGSSSFGNHLSASGGYGANRNNQHEGGRGGLGSGGDINLYGGKGSGHGSSNGYWGSNTGGRSYFGGGNGRRHSDNTDNTGAQLAAPGTGGAGGRGDGGGTGSVGRHGIVIVHEYYKE